MPQLNSLAFPPFSPFFTPSGRGRGKDGSWDFLSRSRQERHAPIISGLPAVGQTIFATLGWFTYQWKRNGVVIGGATASAYLLTDTDAGARITVAVTSAGGSGAVTSAPVGPVALTGADLVYGAETLVYGADTLIYG